MELVQSRIVTGDVQRLVAFYAGLVRASVVLNDYVEVPTGAMSVGFSWSRFTEYREDQTAQVAWGYSALRGGLAYGNHGT